MTRTLRLLLFLLPPVLSPLLPRAQVGINNGSPDASAELDVTSSTRGFLAPRMNTAQMTAISAPAAGLLVFNSDSSTYCVYTGSAWLKVLVSTANHWSASGSHIYSNNSGKVGIGTTSPSSKLHLADGNLLVTGTTGSGPAIEVSGIGTRMFFSPNKAAFRAGFVGSDQWDNAKTGAYSFAAGLSTTASGEGSVSFGVTNTASGTGSTGIGTGNTASGSSSLGMGINNTASGDASLAAGRGNTAGSYAETAIGTYGTTYTVANASASNSSDRIFNIGIGTSSARADALTVLKSGFTGIGKSSPVSTFEVNGSMGTRVKAGQAAGSNHPDATATIWIYGSGSGTITLPAANTCPNRIYTIVNNIGEDRAISAYIPLGGGGSSTNIVGGTSLLLVSDGTNWYQVK
ncbi:hypothetical protein [Flaviaesturariibacter amylovorans]|uniref:Trimeric autotransporter adhesin YadA-like head domain-containing protein n=1 Tax=Flaviaesturariibacter amylovorans TaxID=1084520 RepID=A0ABP8GWH0_9BACT